MTKMHYFSITLSKSSSARSFLPFRFQRSFTFN